MSFRDVGFDSDEFELVFFGGGGGFMLLGLILFYVVMLVGRYWKRVCL